MKETNKCESQAACEFLLSERSVSHSLLCVTREVRRMIPPVRWLNNACAQKYTVNNIQIHFSDVAVWTLNFLLFLFQIPICQGLYLLWLS